jgi:PadR family transcriptional regulator, regulatory protein AphA
MPGRAAPHPRSRQNRTRYVVLGMLTVRSMNGYELRQAIASSVGHFWRESFGQLYPTLRALAGEGLVRPVHERAARAGPGRQGATYQLTPRGREALAAWLATPPVLERPRNELLLRVFFAAASPPAVTLRNLALVGETLRAEATKLEAIASRWTEAVKGHPDAPLWRLTLDFGLGWMAMALGWLEDAQRVIAAGARRAGGATGASPAVRVAVKARRRRAGRPAGGGKRCATRS